jgi:hypothetical protein
MGERTIEQVDYLETLMIQSARPRYNTRTQRDNIDETPSPV